LWAPRGQYSSAVGMGEPSLWVAGAQRPACQHGLPRTMAAAAGMGNPSLKSVGVLGPTCQVPVSRGHRSYCSNRRTKLVGSRSIGDCLQCRLLGTWQSSCCLHEEPSLLAGALHYRWSSGSSRSCLYKGGIFPGISG
jgi:hypothetical protein